MSNNKFCSKSVRTFLGMIIAGICLIAVGLYRDSLFFLVLGILITLLYSVAIIYHRKGATINVFFDIICIVFVVIVCFFLAADSLCEGKFFLAALMILAVLLCCRGLYKALLVYRHKVK